MITSMRLNFYIPINFLNENMIRASVVQSCTQQKFFFRTNIFDDGPAKVEQLSISEIFKGTNNFIGLQALLDQFLATQKMNLHKKDSSEGQSISESQARATFSFLSKRASGEIPTTATVIRSLISHSDLYHGDSMLTADLLDIVTRQMAGIQAGIDSELNDKVKLHVLL